MTHGFSPKIYGDASMTARKTLPERIDEALNGKPMAFYDLAIALYPDRKSHRYQSNGGPPGCYMALSAGIRRGNFSVWHETGKAWEQRTVYPRRHP
jgi:hypothetical protein